MFLKRRIVIDKIYTDAEIRAKADRALIFSWLYTGISISLFVYAGYSFFNDAVVTGFSSMAIGFLLFIPQSIYKSIFDKYTDKSSSQRIKTIIKEIEPYADLRDIFKKMYARGYILEYEEKLLLEEVHLQNAKEHELRLNQDIRSTLNHWEKA